MKNKKHIDSLFKERFENFEATPSPEVWKNIQKKLKKDEEDRKIIPIWWRWAGVAALLILLLMAGKFVFFTGDDSNDNQIVTEETQIDPKNELPDKDSEVPTSTDSSVVDDQQTSDPSQESTDNIDLDDVQGASEDVAVETVTGDEMEPENKAAIADTGMDTVVATGDPKEIKDRDGKVIEDGIIDTDKAVTKEISKETKKDVVPVEGPLNKDAATVIATDTKTTEPQKEGPENLKEANEDIKKEVGITTGIAISDPAGDTEKETIDEVVAETEVEEEEKPSIYDAIEEQNEAIAANQEDKDDKTWEVTPNFAPVYYGSLGEGSSIDPSFADNSQTGDVNFSYGVQVSYQLGERLSIRSGVNNVDLGYSTGGVELATGPTSTALKSVDYGNQGIVLSAFDEGTIGANEMPVPGDPFSELIPKSTGGNAEIIQNLSYYEVPMELKYAVLNKRFGINMIGGFSALILGDNEIVVRDGDFRSTLGEANNLNDFSFSTNIGLGFDYKFSKKFRFSLEPMFKYQLNPYSDSSVSFRPYYLGVYSGLSFRF